MKYPSRLIIALAIAFITVTIISGQKRLPIIDMHIHAELLSEFGDGKLSVCSGDQEIILPAIDPKLPYKLQDVIPCVAPIKPSATDEKVMTETFAKFKKYN